MQEDTTAAQDILYSLFELGSYGLAQKLMGTFKAEQLQPLALCHSVSLEEACNNLNPKHFRIYSYLMRFALRNDQEEYVHQLAKELEETPLSSQDRILCDAYRIWAYLKQEDASSAGAIFDTYPLELLNQETTLLHPLFGCYLHLTEGEEIANIHFAGVIETPFPRSWALLSHELTNQVTQTPGWYSTSFMWERRHLYRLLTLYYTISENPELEAYYRGLEREEYIYAE